METEKRTLMISNIPPNTTMPELMLTIAGPFGKICSIQLEGLPCKKGEALVAFFKQEEAEIFLAYANDQDLCVAGRAVKVNWWHSQHPQQHLYPGLLDSRVVIVEGPRNITKEKAKRFLEKTGLEVDPECLHAIEIFGPRPPKTSRKEVALMFVSYPKAPAAMRRLRGAPPTWKSSYGKDAVEMGVITEWDRENHVPGTPGHLRVVYPSFGSSVVLNALARDADDEIDVDSDTSF